jgi:hypothetical protein
MNTGGQATALFGVEIDDRTGAGVKSSTAQLEQLRAKLDSDTVALSRLETAWKQLNKAAVVDVATAKNLRARLDETRASVVSTTAKIHGMGGAFKKSKSDGSDKAKVGLDQLRSALMQSNGPIGSMSGQVAGLATKLGTAGLVGVLVLAAAAGIALGVAMGVAISKLAMYALVVADAARAEQLHLEALTKIPSWWGRAAGKASELVAITSTMSDKWGVARTEVGKFTRELYAAGYRGNGLKNAVEASSVALAAFGGDASEAQRYMGAISWQFGLMGKGSAAFAARVKKDLGDIAIRQSLGFSKQMGMLRQHIGQLFTDVRIEPFLKSLHGVTSLFSQTTVSGQILKRLFESLLNPLFGGAADAGTAIKHLVQDMIYWALKAQGYWLDLQIWVARTFNYKGDLGTLMALTSLKIALGFAAIAGGALAIAMLGITFSAVTLVAAIGAIGYTLYWVGSQFKWLYDNATNLDWSQLGFDILKGIGNGIINGTKWAVDAILGAAGAIKDAFKKALGIKSPSLVFRTQARFIPMGAALGIRDETPKVWAAARDMAPEPPPRFGGGGFAAAFAPAMHATPAPAGASGGGIGRVAITIQDSRDPSATAREVKRVLLQLMRDANTMTGAAND